MKSIVIKNRLGLHARPVMMFVEVASGFESAITVSNGDQEVDGKSMLMMMTLGATCGTSLEIKAVGDDADEAIAQLAELFDRGFDEE